MSEFDLEAIRRSAEPGAMFGAILVRDLVSRLEQAEQAVARVRELREGQLCGHCADDVQDALEGELE